MSFSAIFLFALRVRNAILIRWWNFSGGLLLRGTGVVTHGSTVLYGFPIISRFPSSVIEIGDKVVLCSDSRFTALGVARPVILRTMRTHARIRIGDHTGMSGAVICSAVSIDIGSFCLLGADVQIMDNDFHKLEPEGRWSDNTPEKIGSAPIVIEDNVFLGAGVKVMKGVRIGRNSVVGAGSVVTKDIPGDSIVVGAPARVIGSVPLRGASAA